jgi:DNA-binding response OmpR family regulator
MTQNAPISLRSDRILSVSYDATLLATRQMILETRGYAVVSALGFLSAADYCRTGACQLVILGHSIPAEDKEELARICRAHTSRPILSLELPGEARVDADYHASVFEPEQFLATVEGILKQSKQGKAAGGI